MASSKLSALTAITSVGDNDLIYVADTADGGSTYSSKRVTRGNLFSGIATESYVTTQISNLVDGAPGVIAAGSARVICSSAGGVGAAVAFTESTSVATTASTTAAGI